MRVQDVMTQGVKTIGPMAAAEEAWQSMRLHRIHHLVVTEGRRIVGVVSDRDIRGAAVRKNRTVGDLMTRPAVAVPPETTVRAAANLMRGRSIGCLLVGSASRAEGIVTVADLLELLGRGIDRPVASTTRWTLKHRVPHRKRARSAGAW